MIDRNKIIESYVNYVLEEERKPSSVYKFCKKYEFSEEEFYKNFGALNKVEEAFWEAIIQSTSDTVHDDESYESYDDKAKLLGFYFTLFENFTLNRSYILQLYHGDAKCKLDVIKSLRKAMKPVIEEKASYFDNQILQFAGKYANKFSEEALMFQFMGLFKFWLNDNSPGFESTDAFIEKTVRFTFDIANIVPLESTIDYGKFLISEFRKVV